MAHFSILRFLPSPVSAILAVLAGFFCAPSAKSAPATRTQKPAPAAKPAPAKIPQQDIYRSAAEVPALDSARIHKLYLGGDFDEAIDMIEQVLKSKKTFSHDDSVFFCKHLGVMYAATYETREKGKYYMHMLLTVEPTARILDMYASDMIYMIFKNIQEEFEATRPGVDHSHQPVAKGPLDTVPVAKTADPANTRSSHTLAWVGAGAAVAAASVAAYFIFSDDGPPTKYVNSDFPK